MKLEASAKRVAIVHDFLYTMRGAERVLDALCELFPSADLFSLIYRKGTLNARIENRRIVSSPVNLLPGNHRWWLALYPWAITRFDLSGYDLVLSSSYAVAKGVRVPEETPHICYCHTPMRYIWDMYEEYFHASRLWLPLRTMVEVTAEFLRAWDMRSASGVDAFIANSTTVAARIRRIYKRDSTIIHPPADADYFTPSTAPREDWYLCASAFSPYKRADLVMEAFKKSGRKLKVVGAGQDEAKIRRLAGGSVVVSSTNGKTTSTARQARRSDTREHHLGERIARVFVQDLVLPSNGDRHRGTGDCLYSAQAGRAQRARGRRWPARTRTLGSGNAAARECARVHGSDGRVCLDAQPSAAAGLASRRGARRGHTCRLYR